MSLHLVWTPTTEDFALFQPGMQSAVKGVRTIQGSHKNDPVVNNIIPLAGSSEVK